PLDLGRGGAQSRPQRGLGGAAGAGRRIGPGGGVAERKGDAVEGESQLLGDDLRQPGAGAGADALRPGDDLGRAISVQDDPGVAGSVPASADPVVGGEAEPAALGAIAGCLMISSLVPAE